MNHRHFIIGNPSSVWMREYIKEIHVKNNDLVYITVFDESELKNKDVYEKMGVHLVTIGKNSSVSEKFMKAIRLIHFGIKHRKHEVFDIVEIHYPPHSFQAYIIAFTLKIMNTKSFIMFWGSDILPLNDSDAKKLERIISNVNAINKLSNKTYKVFNQHYGNRYDHLFLPEALRFGTLALPYIDDLLKKKGKFLCKDEYGIKNGKITIAIGYNGNERQQHLKVLQELNKLPNNIKKKIQIILHIVGINSLEYKNKVINAAKESGMDYIIEEKMLDFEQISRMRVATDIFIHAQTTDGLSGSIRECFSSDTIVINPSWIKYDEFDKLGLEYIQFEKFEDLTTIIYECVSNGTAINFEKNKKLIHSAYSWESVYDTWINSYNRIIG